MPRVIKDIHLHIFWGGTVYTVKVPVSVSRLPPVSFYR